WLLPYSSRHVILHSTESYTNVQNGTISYRNSKGFAALYNMVEKEQQSFVGTLKGHNGWVTQIAVSPVDPNTIISCSRDKTIIIWKLKQDNMMVTGTPFKALHGHGHFVTDVVMSTDGQFALSGSWDRSLRLWDLKAAVTTRRFVDHRHDVLSVAFSHDNRQIVSGSRDRTIKLWNTLAVCKYTIQDDCHQDWVSCVRFSPNKNNPTIVSCGWDKLVKEWNLANCKLKRNHVGHTGYLNAVTVSPDASLCASGGKDGKALLWDLGEGKNVHAMDGNHPINALCFSPNRFWLCAAAGPIIKIWVKAKSHLRLHVRLLISFDLEAKRVVDSLQTEKVSQGRSTPPDCISLAWSPDGQTLYAGYTDNVIRVWQVSSSMEQH
ncbi:hypothetical protein M514_10133, partial [Trichuris suis]